MWTPSSDDPWPSSEIGSCKGESSAPQMPQTTDNRKQNQNIQYT